jgi:hypothetical protein
MISKVGIVLRVNDHHSPGPAHRATHLDPKYLSRVVDRIGCPVLVSRRASDDLHRLTFRLSGKSSFYATRALLGLLQGGFIPDLVLYLVSPQSYSSA